MRFLLLLTFVLVLGSCKVYFTQEMRTQLEKQKIDLKEVQFYTSKKIVLQRIITTDSISRDSTAKINQDSKTIVDLVVIKKNAPGILVKPFENELELKFEECDSCTLKFVQMEHSPHIFYKIGAKKWVNEVGEVPYNGKTYYIRPKTFFFQPDSKEAALKIKKKYWKKFEIKRRKVKGLKLEKAK